MNNAMLSCVAHGCMTIFFTYASVVQLNDPDYIPWIGLYGTAAFLSALYCAKGSQAHCPALTRVSGILRHALCVGALFLFASTCKDDHLHLKSPRMMSKALFDVSSETGRERAGIAVVLLWTASLGLHGSKTNSSCQIASYLYLGVAVLISFAAFAVPILLLDVDMTKEAGHCSGIGFGHIK